MAGTTAPMVSACGALINFITGLHAALGKVNMGPGIIYALQFPHAQPMLDLIAKTLSESNLWKVPKSLIFEDIRKGMGREEPTWIEYYLKHCWTAHSSLAEKFTCHRLTNNPKVYNLPDITPLPKELEAQDCSECGKVVTYQGKSYVTTCAIAGSDGIAISLAPAEYFDLEN